MQGRAGFGGACSACFLEENDCLIFVRLRAQTLLVRDSELETARRVASVAALAVQCGGLLIVLTDAIALVIQVAQVGAGTCVSQVAGLPIKDGSSRKILGAPVAFCIHPGEPETVNSVAGVTGDFVLRSR